MLHEGSTRRRADERQQQEQQKDTSERAGWGEGGYAAAEGGDGDRL